MLVHVFALCWNEEKVLPFFFKHYKDRFKNIRFTIYDNMSTDRSRQIILENGGEIIDNKVEEIRMDIQLSIKNHCWKNSDADWVIVCDIDEWIDCDDQFLENTPYTIIKATGYNMVGNTFNLNKVVRGRYHPWYNKCILFKREAIKEINYRHGCHRCQPEGNLQYNKETVRLYHMKYFHALYYIKRSAQSAKRVSHYNKTNNWSTHYKSNIAKSLTQYLYVRLRSKRIRVLQNSKSQL